MPGTGQPTNQTTSSVESFANNITNSVEQTSAGVVGGVESFLGIRNAANAPPAVAPAQFIVRRQRLRILRLRLRILCLCLCLRRGRRRMHMKTAKINNTRLHLREEKDGTGLLVINASHVLYLDRIGTDFVKHYLRYTGKSRSSAASGTTWCSA